MHDCWAMQYILERELPWWLAICIPSPYILHIWYKIYNQRHGYEYYRGICLFLGTNKHQHSARTDHTMNTFLQVSMLPSIVPLPKQLEHCSQNMHFPKPPGLHECIESWIVPLPDVMSKRSAFVKSSSKR